MHPIVEKIIFAICISTFLLPIIDLIKYDAELRKMYRGIREEMDEEFRKYKADPENYNYTPKE